MAKFVALNCGLFLAGYNLQSIVNQVEVVDKVDLEEVPVFGDEAKRRLAGLRDVTLGASGYADATLPAKVLRDLIATVDAVVSCLPLDPPPTRSRSFLLAPHAAPHPQAALSPAPH